MNTVVDLKPKKEQIIELSKFLDGQKQQEPTLTEVIGKLVGDNHNADAIKKLLESSHTLFESASEKDIEGFFGAFISLVESEGLSEEICESLNKIISGSGDDKVFLRFTVLNHIYNTVKSPASKISSLLHILNFAVESKQSELVISLVENIEKRIEELKPTSEQSRELYRLSFSLSQVYDDILTNVLRVKYLETFDESSASNSSEEIKSVIVALINEPQMFQYESILDLAASKVLKGTTVEKVLDFLVFKNYVDYESFGSTQVDDLTKEGILPDVVSRKMRLLSLATLASQSSTIKLSDVADVLKVDSSDVETWAVDAIVNGIIDAKIDQLESVIYVKHSIQREFTTEQWKEIANNLTTWKENVDALLQGLKGTPSEEVEGSDDNKN